MIMIRIDHRRFPQNHAGKDVVDFLRQANHDKSIRLAYPDHLADRVRRSAHVLQHIGANDSVKKIAL